MSTTEPATTRDRREFLHDVFVTAMEGGVQPWATLKTYHWRRADAPTTYQRHADLCDLDGFKAVLMPGDLGDAEGCWGVWDDEEGDKVPLTVDATVIRKGIVLFREYCVGNIDSRGVDVPADRRLDLPPDHYWQQFLVADRTNGVDGDYDAEVADWIVQFGLFGQQVYG